jgi:nucleotide-binding universal stress UspA family protein
MYRSLLVPLDGSAFAEHALPLALGLARRAGAAVHVVQVHVPFALAYADSLAPGSYEAEARVLEQERAYLDGVVSRLAGLAPAAVTPALLEGPAVAEMLSGHAAVTKADLVVMTTHGRGPLSRLWLGSVADEMVRRAAAPVLLVRPHGGGVDLAAGPELRHLLVPLDGSALAEQILAPATALGGLTQAEFTLLRVYGPAIDVAPLTEAAQGVEGAVGQLRVRAEDYLRRVAEGLKGQGCKVQAHAVVGQHPATAILDAAQGLAVSLIALETHGRRGLPRLLLGSVADKVIRGATTPVLVHRSTVS